MRKLICLIAIAVATGVSANAWAAVVPYYSTNYWQPGMGGGTGFSPSWYSNVFGKSGAFDTTVTFIDNTGYNWRATVRGFATYQETHWLSSQVKKAHCRSNVNANIYGSCIGYS